MAGTYKNYTGYRIAYHLDGTRVFYRTINTLTELTPAQIVTLNDEDSDGIGVSRTTGYFFFMFPRPYNLTGYYVGWTANFSYSTPYLEVSSDTSNFSDGSWSNLGSAGMYISGLSVHQARSSIATISTTGTVGARVYYSQGDFSARSMTFYSINFYGIPSNGVSGDKLWIWHDTLDQRIDPAYFDFGNAPLANTTPLKVFRIKNSSATKTAIAPLVSGAIPTDGSPSVLSTMQFSIDAVSWSVSVTLPDLAPGAISAVVYVRFAVAVNTVTGVRIPLITANPTSMS